jgi:hypothetical protein
VFEWWLAELDPQPAASRTITSIRASPAGTLDHLSDTLKNAITGFR